MNQEQNQYLKNYIKKNINIKENSKLYTLDSVKTHNTKDDCYVGLSGKVYDISKYYKYLEKKQRTNNLNLICGSVSDLDPLNIFKGDKFSNYEVGTIKNYFIKKIVSLVVFVIFVILSFYFGFVYKNKYKYLFYFISIINIYIIIKWLIKIYTYESSVYTGYEQIPIN